MFVNAILSWQLSVDNYEFAIDRLLVTHEMTFWWVYVNKVDLVVGQLFSLVQWITLNPSRLDHR